MRGEQTAFSLLFFFSPPKDEEILGTREGRVCARLRASNRSDLPRPRVVDFFFWLVRQCEEKLACVSRFRPFLRFFIPVDILQDTRGRFIAGRRDFFELIPFRICIDSVTYNVTLSPFVFVRAASCRALRSSFDRVAPTTPSFSSFQGYVAVKLPE